MKKSHFAFKTTRLVIFSISICACIVLLVFTIYKKPAAALDDRGNRIAIADIPIDVVESYGGYWLYMPASENDTISYDISSFFDEEEATHYLIVPSDTDEKKVVFYVRDAADQFAFRVEGDFSGGPIEIGSKYVDIIKTEFPFMEIHLADNSPSFSDIYYDMDMLTNGFGDLSLRVSPEYSSINSCPALFESRDADKDTDGSITIKARGNTTRLYSNGKIPLTLVFEEPVALAGMSKNRRWNLLSNSLDKTLLRNKLFYDMADTMGIDYTCDNEFAVLYVNGDFKGLYLLTTKVSVDKNRVNLHDGDFFVDYRSTHSEQPIWVNTSIRDGWITDGKLHFNLEYPENDTDIEWKQEFLQNMMSAIEDPGSNDYLDYIDVDSFVKYYWINEFSMNRDADNPSTYMYYLAEDQKMHAGPIWDMDQTLGVNERLHGCDMSDPVGFKAREFTWIKMLCDHESFMDAVNKYYYESGFRDEMLKFIDDFEAYKEHISKVGQIDLRKYGLDTRYNMIDYGTDSYEEWCDHTIDFAKKRFEWIDSKMGVQETH